MSQEVTVAYWDCRGRVGVILLLLDYCKVPYNLKLYEFANVEAWFAKDKQNWMDSYPNVPHIIDGDQAVTESVAMIEYVAIKGNRKDLLGKTPEDQIKVDIALNVAKDIFEIVDIACWCEGDFEAEKERIFTTQVNTKLAQCNKLFEKSKWVCGDYLTVADFMLYEDFDFIYQMEKSRLEPYPHAIAFMERFANLPETKAHQQSKNFIQLWLPMSAQWTNSPDHKKKPPPQEVVFGYWPRRGVAQPAIYLLEYLKIPYKEIRYPEREDWLKEKENLGLDFPDLPYLIHGDKKITESFAVFEYIPLIAGNTELNGTDEYMKIEITTLRSVLADLKAEIVRFVFMVAKDEFEKEKEESFEKGVVKDKLTRLNKYLGDKEYLCGKMTVVDFVLFNLIDVLNDMDHDKVKEYSKLMDHHKRFSEIPEIKSYRESDRNPKIWYSPERANWYQKK